MAAMPARWPETIRAMMIHSAEWTPVMKQQFEAAAMEQQKRLLLRKYGYGVASYERQCHLLCGAKWISRAGDFAMLALFSGQIRGNPLCFDG
jgi:hypothetical protein